MPSRSKTIDKMSKMMEKEARAQLESGVGKWNGYAILTVPEWRKVLFSANPSDAIQFLPDDYTDDDTILSIFVGKEEFDKWRKNWMDYLVYRKNPALGRRCCTGCILNSELGPIGRHILTRLGFDGKCQTVDAFLCPNTKFGVEYLVFAGKACRIIERVLLYSAKQAMYDSLKTFRVDCVNGRVFCFDCPGAVNPTEYAIEYQLVPISKRVVLTRPDDYANALNNEGLFCCIFDQYCDFVENGSNHYGKGIVNKKKADEIRKLKLGILSFIKKQKIGRNALEELHQSFLEFEKKERQRLEEHKKLQIAAAPEIFGPIIENQRSGVCVYCGRHANIQCTSCSIWSCITHWKEHYEITHQTGLIKDSFLFIR
jgi:hypothetical protein